MKTFSKCLAEYIEENHLSWQKASRMCGVDRTLLRRYAGGDVLPGDEERVKMIAEGLGMSAPQAEELCNLYFRAKIGEASYDGLTLVDEIFQGKKGQKPRVDLEGKAGRQWEKPQVLNIQDERLICDAVRYLTEEAEWVQFQLNLFSCYGKMIELFAGIHPSCVIEQIVEINNAEDGREEILALEMLLPLLTSRDNYTIFCTYQWKKAFEGRRAGLNLIITDKGMLLFHSDARRGVYTNLEQYGSYYRSVFNREKKKCPVFGGSSGAVSGDSQISSSHPYQIENSHSGVKLVHLCDSAGRERIQVGSNRGERRAYWLEEVGLVRLFKAYMKI